MMTLPSTSSRRMRLGEPTSSLPSGVTVAAFRPKPASFIAARGLLDDRVGRRAAVLEREVVALELELHPDDVGLEHAQRPARAAPARSRRPRARRSSARRPWLATITGRSPPARLGSAAKDERRAMQLVRGRGRSGRGVPRVRARGRAQGRLLPPRARRAVGHPGRPLGSRDDPARPASPTTAWAAARTAAARWATAACCSSAIAASTASPTRSAASTTCCSGRRPGGAGRRRASSRLFGCRPRCALRRCAAFTASPRGKGGCGGQWRPSSSSSGGCATFREPWSSLEDRTRRSGVCSRRALPVNVANSLPRTTRRPDHRHRPFPSVRP